MAKAKKSVKKTAKVKLATAAKLPAGFTAVAVGGGSSFVNWEVQKIVQGKVTNCYKKKGEYGIQRYIDVMQADKVSIAIPESGALKNLFDEAKKGKQVFIQYLGSIPLKGGKTYKQFQAAIK